MRPRSTFYRAVALALVPALLLDAGTVPVTVLSRSGTVPARTSAGTVTQLKASALSVTGTRNETVVVWVPQQNRYEHTDVFCVQAVSQRLRWFTRPAIKRSDAVEASRP